MIVYHGATYFITPRARQTVWSMRRNATVAFLVKHGVHEESRKIEYILKS